MRRREVDGLWDIPTEILSMPMSSSSESGGEWWSRFRAWMDRLQPILRERDLDFDNVRQELCRREGPVDA